MNENTELERVLSCLTIGELKHIKDHLLMYYFDKKNNRLNLPKENLDDIFKTPEIEECIKTGIDNVGVYQMNVLVSETIKEKQDKENIEEMDKRDVKMNIYERELRIENLLKGLNIQELESVERGLSRFIDDEDKPRHVYIETLNFLESNYREHLNVININYLIKEAIFNLGVFKVHYLVVDALQKKTIEHTIISEKINELQFKIIEWGRAKNIKTPKNQFLKVIEEIGEIQLAKNEDEFMDAIGDTLVTLIILNDVSQRRVKERNKNEIELLDIGKNIEEDFNKYLDDKKESKEAEDLTHCINTDIIVEVSKIAEHISKMTKQIKEKKGRYVEKIHFHILETVKYVKYLALYKNVDYIECLQLAYDTIANRKGKTIGGVFVKEEDL